MMAVNKTLGAREDARSSEEEEEEEVEKLEADVKELAHKILEYRATLPDQVRTTLASALAAQRPVSPDGFGLAPSGAPNTDSGGRFKSSEVAPQAEEDQEMAKKIQLLKDKISSNASAMPIVLKRMKDCISKIDKLDSNNGIIHPAFKRKKTS